MAPRTSIAVLPLLALLAVPAPAGAATSVSVQNVDGVGPVVVATDADSAAVVEVEVATDVSDPTVHYVFLKSSTGASAADASCQVIGDIVACPGDVAAVVVNANGGNDKVTMKLISDGFRLNGVASGGDGDDELRSQPDFRDVPQPNVFFQGDAGNDTIVSGNGADELHGGEGNDTMQSFEGPDKVFGEGGNDSVSAGKEEPDANAADVVNGGAGFDEIPLVDADYNRGFDDNVSVTVDGVADDGEPGEGDNVIDVEKFSVTANQATIRGSGGADDIFVEANTSSIKGLGGNDRLVAYDGNDTIEGGDGDDFLEGGFGNDTLDGGPGRDQFNGDRTESNVIAVGNDDIRARDGVSEQVACGIGSDRAEVDGNDVVAADCESVSRSSRRFGSSTRVTLALVAGRIAGNGPLKVRIRNANAFVVTGSVSGQTTKAIATQRKSKVKLKAKRFSVGANARKTVALKLPAALKRALKRTRKLSLRMTVKVKDPAGTTRTVRKKITVRLKRG